MTIGPVRQARWLGWPLLVLAAAAAGFLPSLAIGGVARRLNPLLSFHAAVTRQNAANEPSGGWYPAERMRDEALEAMTLWPAYAAFQERVMGSLSAAKYADFVVLDRDIMTIPADEILTTHVMATYAGGVPVYRAGL
jgi:predicted amidohydrolase YtcJ